MRTQWIVGAAVGLLIGLIGTTLWRQSEVHAQQPAAKVAFEYKVVEFGTGFLNSESADDMSKKLTKLGDEGWEYVGPVANGADDRRFLQGFVAFRRAKK